MVKSQKDSHLCEESGEYTGRKLFADAREDTSNGTMTLVNIPMTKARAGRAEIN